MVPVAQKQSMQERLCGLLSRYGQDSRSTRPVSTTDGQDDQASRANNHRSWLPETFKKFATSGQPGCYYEETRKAVLARDGRCNSSVFPQSLQRGDVACLVFVWMRTPFPPLHALGTILPTKHAQGIVTSPSDIRAACSACQNLASVPRFSRDSSK